MKSLIIMICVYMFCNAEELSPSTTSILSLMKMIINSDWDLIEDRSFIDSLTSIKNKEREILKKINVLDKNIKYISQMVTNMRLDTMSDVVKHLNETAKVQIEFNDLIGFINGVEKIYMLMLKYLSDKEAAERPILTNFARSDVLSDSSFSVKMYMKKIHKFVLPKKSVGCPSLLEIFSTIEDLDNNSVCISRQSRNQVLYNFYNIISLTYIKAYAMLQLSHMLLEVHGEFSHGVEFQKTKNNFVNISIEFAEKVKTALHKTSLHFWRCDPKIYQNGINYLEITRLLQGYISNEITINAKGACKETCSYYKETKHYNCRNDQYCREQRRCNGDILNCENTDPDLHICLANSNSTRRYKYIEYSNGKILGHKEYCPKISEVKGWQRGVSWPCSYCICLCDEDSLYSDRYFSLRVAASNVRQNKVVTGLRFVKKNRIIHLQVQHGELLSYGVINETTLEWVPVDNFRKTDRFVYSGQDYFKLNWKDRAIDLDILNGKNDRVLTGVRLFAIASHLRLEIRVTSFDFETGKLRRPKNSSEWIFNNNTEYSFDKRIEINLEKPDVPIRIGCPSKVISNHNEFVQFAHTDFDKDVAQTTVPFIDAQDVVPAVPTPISGAGVYFKTTNGSGGFIGLKLITYNFDKHLNYGYKNP